MENENNNPSVHNINEYKKSLQLVSDLEKILQVVKATQHSLRNYEKYIPVKHILSILSEERIFIELHLETNKVVVETKGKKGL